MLDNETPSIEEMDKEFKSEINQIDLGERAAGPKVALPTIKIPTPLVGRIIALENALILSSITKDCSSSLKERAREAIEPSKEELESTAEFLNLLIDRYAPNVVQDPLKLAACVWATCAAMKAVTVLELKMAHGGAK